MRNRLNLSVTWKDFPTVSLATFRLLTCTTNVQSLKIFTSVSWLKLGCLRINLLTGLLSTQRNRRLS